MCMSTASDNPMYGLYPEFGFKPKFQILAREEENVDADQP